MQETGCDEENSNIEQITGSTYTEAGCRESGKSSLQK
jgi:hypothetical protein